MTLTAYQSIVLSDSPLGYWPLNDASGTVAHDISGNARHGTIFGGVTLNQAGLLPNGDAGGKGMLFDGSTGAISLPQSGFPTGAQPWTQEGWISPGAGSLDGNYHGIVGFGTWGVASRDMAVMYLHLAGLIFSGYSNDTAPTTPAMVVGSVHYCALTYDGTAVRVFLDGIQVTSLTTALTVIAGGQWISRNPTNNQDYFAGTIQHVAVYPTALTPTRILAHYQTATQTPSSYTAVIGGIPVNVMQGSLHVENQIGQRAQGGLRVWGPLGVVYQYGTQVQVYDTTGALVYSGFTTKDRVSKPGGARQGTGVLEHDIQLMGNAYKADKRRVFKTYLLQTAGFIVNDLWGSYLAQEGVTIKPGSVATGPNITEVIWSGNKSVGEALTWLATQSGYWWQIDANGVLWFQPYGGIPAPFAIDGTQIDAMQTLEAEFGNDMYVNKQFAKGGFAETGVLTETFHGDGVKRAFTLSYPVNTIVKTKKHPTLGVTLNGVAQTLGTKGSTGQPFYYAKGDAVIAEDPSQTILGSGDTLVVTYTGRFPILASAQNQQLITAQKAREGSGSGLVESTYVNTKVHTLDAAFQIASALLAHFGQDTTILTFSTRTKGLLPGQLLPVNLPDFALNNKQMLISSVTIDDQGPDGFLTWFRVKAVGSAVETYQWLTYWQNLMNQSSDPSDFTDTQSTTLALLTLSQVILTWVGTVTPRKVSCPIFNDSLIFNASSPIFC